MLKATPLAPAGGPIDVCWHHGWICVAWQDGPGPDARLVYQEIDAAQPTLPVLRSLSWHLGSDVGAFPRLLSAHDSVWLIYRNGASLGGRAILRRDGQEVWRSPVACGGNDPVCLGVQGARGAMFAWQRAGDNQILSGRCLTPEGQFPEGFGRPTGLSHIPVSGVVVLVDDARGLVHGMTRPSWAGDLVAGEHPDAGALVRAGDGRELLAFAAQEAFTPRLAYDAITRTYAVVTWGRQGVRLATFTEADLVTPAPAPVPVWDATGTVVDCARFFRLDVATVPREASDGQCWQAHTVLCDDVMFAETEIFIVKGADPRFVEILRVTDDDVRLAYDATDSRYPRAWRLDVVGDGRSDAKWCPIIGAVGGWRAEYPDATLVRRTEGGPSTREPFPYAVGIEAHGRHIDYGGDVGVVDAVLVTRYEPHAGKTADGYHELHHWAIVNGRAIGLVRYEEVRNGAVVRSFTFNRHAPSRNVPLSSLIVHPIPDPPADVPMPEPEPAPMPTLPTHLTLRSAHGRYLCAESGGGTFVVADREAAGPWETWRVMPGHTSTTVALQASDGHYMCAHEGGGSFVVADRQSVGPWESWRVERHGDGIALRADWSGLYLCAEYGGSVTVTRTEAHAWEIWAPTKVDVVTPPPPTPEPGEPLPDPGPSRVLPLIVDGAGRVFRTPSGGIYDYREASSFMLLARARGQNGSTLEDAVARAVHLRDRHRMNVLRVFATIGHPTFWQARGWKLFAGDPGLYNDMARLTQALVAQGIRPRWTLLADTDWTCPSAAAQTLHVQECAVALAPWVDQVFVELCNEPTMNGFGSEWAATLAGYALRIDQRFMIALGPEHGSTGHLKTADRPPADLVYFHPERVTSEAGWAWIRRLSEYGVVIDGERPVASGEPVNAGDEGAPGDYLRDPAIWFAYGALSRVVPQSGYMPTMHYDDGLWSDLPNDATSRCFDAFNAGCDAVPIEAKRGQWVNGHWVEAPWRGFSQTDPPSDDRPTRIFGRIVAGTYWGVSIREPKGWTWNDLRYPVARVARVSGDRFDCSVWKGRIA